MSDTKELNGKQTRTPRSFDAILNGALSLSLKERVDLKNALSSSIEKEVKELKERAAQAEQIAAVN